MEQQELGFNYRLTDIQCALGLSQLRQARALRRAPQRDRRALPRRRSPTSTGCGCRPRRRAGARHAYHLFVVRHRDGATRAGALRRPARARRSSPRSTTSRSTGTRGTASTYGYAPGLCPEAEDYYAGCLSLPCFPALTEAEQDTRDRRGAGARLASWCTKFGLASS